MNRRLLIILALSLVLSGAASERAAADGLSPGAIGALSLVGVMPHLADIRGFYDLGIMIPRGSSVETNFFEGLVDGSDLVSAAGWGVRPHLVMQGQYVGINGSVALDFGAKSSLGGGLRYRRSFGLGMRLHSGFNTLFFLGEGFPVMLTIGPLLDIGMGSAHSLELREEGEVIGSAVYAHLSELALVPSASIAVTRGPILMQAYAAWLPGIPPFQMQLISLSKTKGVFKPDDDASRGERPLAGSEAIREINERIRSTRPAGGYLLGAGIYGPGFINTTMTTLTVGVEVAYGHRLYRGNAAYSGLGGDYFVNDLRISIGWGMYMPNGLRPPPSELE